LLFLLAVLGLLPACSREQIVSHLPGVIQADIENSPITLDPRFASDALSSRISELVFDSLVKLDANGRLVGHIAESIERPSPTELVFHLRHDVHFSDGRALTARDVVFTYVSVTEPANLSPKRAGFAQLQSIAAVDAYTVLVTTTRPYAPALEMGMLGIVPFGSPAVSHATAGELPVGSGPFRVRRFLRDEMVVLDRNPFRPLPPRAIRAIMFKVVPDPTVRALELAEGICDFSENNIEPFLVDYLNKRPGLRIVKSPGSTYQYLAFNFRDPHLRDIRVRRAIAYAIDRESIVHSVLRDTARVATGMLTPENWAYEPDVMQYPYDPAKARELLEEAGYQAARDGTRFTLVYKTTPEGRRLAEALQAMLKAVGIRLVVRSNEWATFYGDIQHGNFDLTSMQWVGINDPHHYFLVFDSKSTPPNGYNRGWYSNPEMDRLVEEGDAEIDSDRRRTIYSAVQKLAAEDLPYVSLWWQDNVAVMNDGLTGFTPYPNGSLRSLATLTLAPTHASGVAERAR
jgi:peptide/nickel transport system substrate-binding protein